MGVCTSGCRARAGQGDASARASDRSSDAWSKGSPMPRRIKAFTLVELLVVIGIIAVLISFLLPVLNRSRQTSVSLHCMSNLRQIGQAAVMYANENNGFFP